MISNKENFFVLMVLGPPASGKGTQIRLLAEKFGFFHFISSDIGKEYIRTHNDPLTLEQKERYSAGLLFDHNWMFNVIKKKTEEIFNDKDNCRGIIYDGSPRTLYEAENLYNFLIKFIDKNNLKVIYIEIDEDKLRERIEKRLICSKNNKHVYILSPDFIVGGSCPECDGVLMKRDLDDKNIFNVRMKEYRENTMLGLEFLRKNHGIITINGDQTIGAVHSDIIKKLGLV